MREYAEVLLDSIAARDPGLLPLAPRYRATENSVAGSPNMLSAWRTVTGVRTVGQVLVDESAGAAFVTAALDEGGSSTLLWARIAVVDERITELELYLARARAEGGFVLNVDEVGTLPGGWTSPIPDGGRATRDELERLGRAAFDESYPAPASSPDCVLMELGGVVLEDVEYFEVMMGGEDSGRGGERQSMPAGIMPGGPQDPDARILVVDEEQGVVVVAGMVHGFVSPYVVKNATESCFVPAAMIEMHHRTLREDRFAGRAVLEESPATCVSIHVLRMHSGLLQGMQMFNRIQAPGGGSPWLA